MRTATVASWNEGEPDLERLNYEIGVAEKEHDVEFFRDLLADDLLFRRATGAVINKRQFLTELNTISYDSIETEVEDVEYSPYGVIAAVRVKAQGTRKDPAGRTVPFGGVFLNVRRFVQRNGRWQLVMWTNRRMEGY